MEIGCCHGHIAKRSNTKRIFILFEVCHIINARVLGWKLSRINRVDHAQAFEKTTTNIGPVVTDNTACIDKGEHAEQFVRGQSTLITVQKVIKFRWRHEGFFESGDCCRHVIKGQCVPLIGKGRVKLFTVPRNSVQCLDYIFRRVRHFHGCNHRSFGLLCESVRTPVPKLGDVEDGVQYGWRVPFTC